MLRAPGDRTDDQGRPAGPLDGGHLGLPCTAIAACANPASPHLISEIRLICELARAVLEPNPRVRWDAYMQDYAEIRKEIGKTLPDSFWDYERRMWEPGGFQRDMPVKRANGARHRPRNFVTPNALDEDADMPAIGHDVLRLMTLRSNTTSSTPPSTVTTTVPGYQQHPEVVLMNRSDIDRLG